MCAIGTDRADSLLPQVEDNLMGHVLGQVVHDVYVYSFTTDWPSSSGWTKRG